ncbi:hypothetical protein GLYMA_09G160050v4 [Glycine max]|nr:hypothetical protein GLYMA_09G160050v4 [Glycine max]KAH1043236.1 hypothetical protein GYH30_025202 [Glycine max]
MVILVLPLCIPPTFFLHIPSCNSPHHPYVNRYGQTSFTQIWAMSFMPPYFLTCFFLTTRFTKC